MRQLPLLLLIQLVLTSTTWAQGNDKIDSLKWMSGQWTAENQEEHWSAPKGKTVLGYHRDFKEGATVFFEFLRIEEDAQGDITYWASPAGKSWTPFALTFTDKNAVQFSNPNHDFPKDISYRRTGNVMHVKISDGGSKQVEWKWHLASPKGE